MRTLVRFIALLAGGTYAGMWLGWQFLRWLAKDRNDVGPVVARGMAYRREIDRA